jgi:hypothetical protein
MGRGPLPSNRTEGTTVPNAQLLREEIAFIKTLPDALSVERDVDGYPLADCWNQNWWFVVEPGCGSAGCLAGYTAAHAGLEFTTKYGLAVWADSIPAPLLERYRKDGGELPKDDETGKAFISTAEAAALLLGLTDDQSLALFAPHNSLAELEEFAEQFIADAAEQSDAEAEPASEPAR